MYNIICKCGDTIWYNMENCDINNIDNILENINVHQWYTPYGNKDFPKTAKQKWHAWIKICCSIATVPFEVNLLLGQCCKQDVVLILKYKGGNK